MNSWKHIYHFIKGHFQDTDEQPEEEMHRARDVSKDAELPCPGGSGPLELGCVPLPVWVPSLVEGLRRGFMASSIR